MATYKTKDGTLTGVVPGVGEIVGGLLKNAPENLENPNLVKVPEQTAPVPQAAPVAPAVLPQAQPPQPQNEQSTNKETK